MFLAWGKSRQLMRQNDRGNGSERPYDTGDVAQRRSSWRELRAEDARLRAFLSRYTLPWRGKTAVKTISRENGSADFAQILNEGLTFGPLPADIMVFGKNSTVILASFHKLFFWIFIWKSSCDFVMGPRAKPMVPIDSAGFVHPVCIKKTHPESLRYFSQFLKNDPFLGSF